MPLQPGSSDPDLWIVDLPPSRETSAGSMTGIRISAGGIEQARDNEDRYYTCKLEGVELYLVLDGHNGTRACEFAMKRIPSLLLRRNMGEGGEMAAGALKYTFENTEKQFFMMLDHSITRKMGLQIEMQEKGGTTSMLAYSMFPEKVEELQRLEEQISGGTTAVLALILNGQQLWVANVGDSRAVLCYLDGTGKLHAEQISEDHNTKNDKEIERLVGCGLDEVRLRSSGRLGSHQNTRSIGDYSIKGGYKDHDILSTATREPGIAEPFISHPPLDITAIRGFLLLMSDGLYDAHASLTNSPQTVNHDIALLVQRHLDTAPAIDDVAAKVIAEVSTNFQAMVQRTGENARMDDITLVIRNLGYPVGQLSGNFISSPPPASSGYQPQLHQQLQHQALGGTASSHRYENAAFLQEQQPYRHQQQHHPGMAFSSSPHYTLAATASTLPPASSSVSHTPYSSAHQTVHSGLHHVGHHQLNPNSTYAGPQLHHAAHYPHPIGHNAQYPLQPHQMHGNSGYSSQTQVLGTGHHAQTHSTNQPHSLAPNTTYENWEVRGRGRDGNLRPIHEDMTDLMTNVGALNIGTNGLAPAHQRSPGSFLAGGQHHHGPLSSTNAETQFQSAQHVSQASSQQRSPNVTVNWREAADNSGSRTMVDGDSEVGKQSVVDDESWMYNHESEDGSDQVEGREEREEGGENERHEGGQEGDEDQEDRHSGGRDGDSTVVVELELEDERERAYSQVEEEEEENGMIKPMIKFDKFPPDLSWDQI